MGSRRQYGARCVTVERSACRHDDSNGALMPLMAVFPVIKAHASQSSLSSEITDWVKRASVRYYVAVSPYDGRSYHILYLRRTR